MVIKISESLDPGCDDKTINTLRRARALDQESLLAVFYQTKIRRKEFGFSHEDLATRTGGTVKEITRIERCGINTPAFVKKSPGTNRSHLQRHNMCCFDLRVGKTKTSC